MMANKMKELDMKETSSKSLLSNVLDMDDDFRNTTLPTTNPVHHPSHVAGHQNGGFVRWKLRILRFTLGRGEGGGCLSSLILYFAGGGEGEFHCRVECSS